MNARLDPALRRGRKLSDADCSAHGLRTVAFACVGVRNRLELWLLVPEDDRDLQSRDQCRAITPVADALARPSSVTGFSSPNRLGVGFTNSSPWTCATAAAIRIAANAGKQRRAKRAIPPAFLNVVSLAHGVSLVRRELQASCRRI